MSSTPSKKTEKQIEINLVDDAKTARSFVYFNTYHIEPLEEGCLLRVGHLSGGVIPAIHSFLVHRTALKNIKESAVDYIKELASASPRPQQPLYSQVVNSPALVNHMVLARTGDLAEISMNLLPVATIAKIHRMKNSTKEDASVFTLALLHSRVDIHRSLMAEMLTTV